MRGDKSFAYDLIVRYGPVSSRVALLLRSAEGKPPSTRFVYNTLHLVLCWSGLRRSLRGLGGVGGGGTRRSKGGERVSSSVSSESPSRFPCQVYLQAPRSSCAERISRILSSQVRLRARDPVATLLQGNRELTGWSPNGSWSCKITRE